MMNTHMERTEGIKRTCIIWYYLFMFLHLMMLILELSMGFNGSGAPMELKEVFDLLFSITFYTKIIEQDPRGGIVVVFVIPIFLLCSLINNFIFPKYKEDELALDRTIILNYITSIVMLSILNFFLCMVYDNSNGNMVFLYCQIIPTALLIFKYPTKDKIDRMIEEAVNKNNMLPDAPPKAPDANK